jgi:hypothetical protein
VTANSRHPDRSEAEWRDPFMWQQRKRRPLGFAALRSG